MRLTWDAFKIAFMAYSSHVSQTHARLVIILLRQFEDICRLDHTVTTRGHNANIMDNTVTTRGHNANIINSKAA